MFKTMFKKLHLQLTVFCTLVTGSILLAMTCACLAVLHADTSRQSFASFEKNVSSMISYLENQPVISHPWLLELERDRHFQVFITIQQRFYASLRWQSNRPACGNKTEK